MKRTILIAALFATSFIGNAQVNPAFQAKADNLFNTIESVFASSVNAPTDFTSIFTAVEVVVKDVDFANQWALYTADFTKTKRVFLKKSEISFASSKKDAVFLNHLCLAMSITNFAICTSTPCNPCPPNHYVHCYSDLRNSFLQCFGFPTTS